MTVVGIPLRTLRLCGRQCFLDSCFFRNDNKNGGGNKDSGGEFVNASDAFNDPVSMNSPDILPAGESLIWGMAKESGKFEEILHYPGEDGDYEEEKLNEYLKK